MSVAFAAHRQRGKGDITPAAIQKLLDENNHLIQCIMDFQSKGKTAECSQYQQMLHRNLVYLATIADSNQNMQSLLPAKSDSPTTEIKHEPPSQNMAMGPGGMNQGGPPQSPHGHSMPPEGMVSGGPPASHMQNQMNGQMPGPMMHQQPPSQQYSIPQGGGQHYQGQQNPMAMMAQVSQGNHVMGQRPMPPYRPPQQGPPQQYAGQEDYYGEQYSHGAQGPPEGLNDYGYQQPSYPEQGNDRPYEDSSQHYFEGGNSQYTQQQEAYQQGPPQQQGYPPQQQQQYPGQQAYPGQQQGYGPSQGTPGQYPSYSQGQGQQYGGYRPPQPGQPQQQRPYGYDQGQYGNYQQ
ncbi:protein SSXT-like isoform X6 [Acipenser ruthenus]|uniref:protein SSXT-like isoform X6 n=1 Tax=Acipenser ruthenus TaxID=7906 RepID=UPI002740690A|nr:protein SSXT-like isoform X6 [Acipenser ruthenus]